MNTTQTELATFGAGCFWGVEEVFRKVPGVVDAAVGYLGGTLTNPTYEDVCTGTTGHAEVVQVTFDPSKVSYQELLDVFWNCHNPTTRNRQGPDIGEQYRSAIFTHSPEQKRIAEASKEALQSSGKYQNPIVTEVTQATDFYRAEEYHQQYLKSTEGVVMCSYKLMWASRSGPTPIPYSLHPTLSSISCNRSVSAGGRSSLAWV